MGDDTGVRSANRGGIWARKSWLSVRISVYPPLIGPKGSLAGAMCAAWPIKCGPSQAWGGAHMSIHPAIHRRTLHDELVALLRNMIIEGELRPGSRISESRLCTRFGVSRTPLREALKVLSVEGLVRLLPNKGASVVRVTHKQVEETLAILGVLEALAGELACARIDNEGFGRIKSTHT